MYEKIKKIIARDGSRDVVDSDVIELMNIIEDGNIPDFKDKSIICIKFAVSDTDSFEDSEESCWYINKEYAEKFIKPCELPVPGNAVYAPFKRTNGVYSIFSDFLPEVFLMNPSDKYDIFEAYQTFYNQNMPILSGMQIEQIYNMFLDFLKDYP